MELVNKITSNPLALELLRNKINAETTPKEDLPDVIGIEEVVEILQRSPRTICKLRKKYPEIAYGKWSHSYKRKEVEMLAKTLRRTYHKREYKQYATSTKIR